jgi:hypothetical protein
MAKVVNHTRSTVEVLEPGENEPLGWVKPGETMDIPGDIDIGALQLIVNNVNRDDTVTLTMS